MGRNITMKDIAKYLNIDRTTVSKALANHPGVSAKTIEKVKAAAAELGYRKDSFASGLMTGKNAVLAIVLADITRGIYAPLVEKFQRTARKYNYGVILYYVNRNEDDFLNVLDLLRLQRVSGVTFVSSATSEQLNSHLIELAESGIAVNTTGRNFIHDKIDWIRFDNRQAGYDLTRYLIQSGHQRIAFIADTSGGAPEERKSGYIEAIHEAKLEPLLIEEPRRVPYIPGSEVRLGYELLNNSWNRMPTPSAVIGVNDDYALGVLYALKEKGIAVPQDISLAGFDDWRAVLGIPQITSMRMPVLESGEWAVRLLMDRIKDQKKASTHVLLEYEMVLRESTQAFNEAPNL